MTTNLPAKVWNTLGAALFMIENEVRFIRTGQSKGPDMRNDIERWQSLIRDIKDCLDDDLRRKLGSAPLEELLKQAKTEPAENQASKLEQRPD